MGFLNFNKLFKNKQKDELKDRSERDAWFDAKFASLADWQRDNLCQILPYLQNDEAGIFPKLTLLPISEEEKYKYFPELKFNKKEDKPLKEGELPASIQKDIDAVKENQNDDHKPVHN